MTPLPGLSFEPPESEDGSSTTGQWWGGLLGAHPGPLCPWQKVSALSSPALRAKYQNSRLESKLSTFSGLFVGIGWTQAKKTLKLVKLANSFLMHAIHVGYQRRELIPAHQCNRRTAKQMSKCQQFG